MEIPVTKRLSDEGNRDVLRQWLNSKSSSVMEEVDVDESSWHNQSTSPVLNPSQHMPTASPSGQTAIPAPTAHAMASLSLSDGIHQTNEQWSLSVDEGGGGGSNTSDARDLALAEEFDLAVALSASTSEVVAEYDLHLESILKRALNGTAQAKAISMVLKDMSSQLPPRKHKKNYLNADSESDIALASDDPSYVQIIGGNSEDEDTSDGSLDIDDDEGQCDMFTPDEDREEAAERLARHPMMRGRRARAATTEAEVITEVIAQGKEVEGDLRGHIEALISYGEVKSGKVSEALDEALVSLRLLQAAIKDASFENQKPETATRGGSSGSLEQTGEMVDDPRRSSGSINFSQVATSVAAAAAAMGLGVSPTSSYLTSPEYTSSRGLGKKSSSSESTSSKDKLKSLIDTVRTGPTLEARIGAVHKLSELASTPSSCGEVVECDGLKAMVRLFESKFANESYDLEVETAITIAHLVPGVFEASDLLAVAFPILSALKLVLLRFTATAQIPSAPPLPLSVMQQSPRITQRVKSVSVEGISQVVKSSGVSDNLSCLSPNSARLLVATALSHFASLLQQEWASSDRTIGTGRNVKDESKTQPKSVSSSSSTSTSKSTTSKSPVQSPPQPPSNRDARLRFYDNHANGVVDREHILSGIVTVCVQVASKPKGGIVNNKAEEQDEDDGDDEDGGGKEEKAERFAAFALCTIIAFAGSAPLISHYEAIPILVAWLRSPKRQVVGFAVGAVAGLCCEDSPSEADVYSSGYLDARLVNEGVVGALIHLIHVDPIFKLRVKGNTDCSSTLCGVKWPEVAAQAVAALRALCRHPPNQEEVLRSTSKDGRLSGLGALVALLNTACVGIPHDRIVTDVSRTLLSLSEFSESRFTSRSAEDVGRTIEEMVAHGVLPALAKIATLLPGANAMKRQDMMGNSVGGTLQSSSGRSISGSSGNDGGSALEGGVTSNENQLLNEENSSILSLRLLVRIAKVRHLRPCFFEVPGSDALESFLEIASLASMRPAHVSVGGGSESSTTTTPNSGSNPTTSNVVTSPSHNAGVISLGRLWDELARLAVNGLQVLSATADEYQLKLFVDENAIETLLQLCRVAERAKDTALLYPCVATLSRLVSFLLSVDEVFNLAPETLPRSFDTRERSRLKVLFKFLRILKMRRPTLTNNGIPNHEGPPSQSSIDLSIYLKTQLAAVRALSKLSQHPGCRTLLVDYGLEELVALAVGAPSMNQNAVEGTQLVRSDSGGNQPPLSDPLLKVEDELRVEAENTIIALGFDQGYRDIELCFNDATLLAVWFHHKRSLQHQGQSHNICSTCNDILTYKPPSPLSFVGYIWNSGCSLGCGMWLSASLG